MLATHNNERPRRTTNRNAYLTTLKALYSERELKKENKDTAIYVERDIMPEMRRLKEDITGWGASLGKMSLGGLGPTGKQPACIRAAVGNASALKWPRVQLALQWQCHMFERLRSSPH